MMYPFMVLGDETAVVHSQILHRNNNECVKVYFEKPIYGGFKNATCYLPDYTWEDVNGYSEKEIADLQGFLESTAHLIYRFAGEGGFGNAAGI